MSAVEAEICWLGDAGASLDGVRGRRRLRRARGGGRELAPRFLHALHVNHHSQTCRSSCSGYRPTSFGGEQESSRLKTYRPVAARNACTKRRSRFVKSFPSNAQGSFDAPPPRDLHSYRAVRLPPARLRMDHAVRRQYQKQPAISVVPRARTLPAWSVPIRGCRNASAVEPPHSFCGWIASSSARCAQRQYENRTACDHQVAAMSLAEVCGARTLHVYAGDEAQFGPRIW